jgi:hypothetical protein
MARVLLVVAFVGVFVLWQVQHYAVVESDVVRARDAESADRAP